MYDVDSLDTVIRLEGVPQSCTGAPLPVVVAEEGMVLLAYLAVKHDPRWDGTYTTSLSQDSPDRPVVLVTFIPAYAHIFGQPNDEVLHGHPLYSRGLTHYGIFEVRQSSWVRRLEKINSVHHRHNRESYLAGMNHYIFAFHDSTFECIAGGLQIETFIGSMQMAVSRMAEILNRSSDPTL